MTTKHTPATTLPWRIFAYRDTLEISPPEPSGLGERPAVVFWQGFDGNGLTKRANSKNAAYIVHAANAYPQLVKHMWAIEAHLQRGAPAAEGHALRQQHRALLRELGEAE